MLFCFSCSTELPDRATYCPSCTIQVRCKSQDCRDILELNARACVSCGTLISDSSAITRSNPTSPLSPAVNVLTFDETSKSRSLRAHLTDTAVDSLGQALSSFITNRLDRRERVTPQNLMQEHSPYGQQQLLPGVAEDVNTQEAIIVDTESPGETSSPIPPHTEQESVMRFFRRAGNQLQLEDPRLKAANKLDYARRLTYLFLYAHYQEGRDRVSRTDLNAVLAASTVNDTNTRAWIRTNSSLVKEGELIGLNQAGRDEAKIALNEALDPDRNYDWVPGTERARSKANSTKATESTRSSRPSGRKVGRPSVVNDWIAKWKAQNPSVNAHSILEKRTVADKGIFALWAIRDLVGDTGKIVSGATLAKFILEAFEFKIHPRSIEKALESKPATGKVLKLKGGYQVQPPGIEHAKQMAKAAATVGASSIAASKN
jgi:hypothetical protein